MNVTVCDLPDSKLAYTNYVYVNDQTYTALKDLNMNRGASADEDVYISIQGVVYKTEDSSELTNSQLAMSGPQRMFCNVEKKMYEISIFPITPALEIGSIVISVGPISTKKVSKLEIDVNECSIYLLSFLDKHIFRIGQSVPCKYKGRQLKFTVESFVGGARTSSASLGMFTRSTEITLRLGLNAGECGISLKGGLGKKLEFKGNFDFESMGIGGLDTQFTSMFRKAFASRMFPGVVAKMGLNHVRGMLLYGPPGCGKTLIARQIARILDVDDGNIKIINGPEVLSKMIGESEENIRKQFADAEAEQKAKGDDSSLHIIIFDEMDSIMKVRGVCFLIFFSF